MAATAAATSQNKPANSNCTCCGSRLRPAMFEDLLVDIIGEKSSAPPNIAASNPVMAGPRFGNLRPDAMSLNTGMSSDRRALAEGISGERT